MLIELMPELRVGCSTRFGAEWLAQAPPAPSQVGQRLQSDGEFCLDEHAADDDWMSDSASDGAAAFDALVDALNYPMFVVTTAVDGRNAGCLVGFATQVSIDPRRFLVGLSRENFTYRMASEADHLVVHVLGAGHRELARLFGSTTGDDVDKFAHCQWHRGPHGLPVLDAAAAWFSGRILSRVPCGDHVAFLLEPCDGHWSRSSGPLVSFADVQDLEPGHDA